VTDKCWCGGRLSTQGVPPTDEARCLDSSFHDPFATGRPVKIEKLYVAGPMSGYEFCNYPLFGEVSNELRAAGFEVVNPAEFGDGGHYVDILRGDLKQLLDCHGVALLPNWWESVGARTEVQVAGLLMMPVREWKEWL
jgi:hypothetical protein